MGADIHGWVEVRNRRHEAMWDQRDSTEDWHAIVKIDHLVDRNYNLFSGLFGHRNPGQFPSAAPGRGEAPYPTVEFWAE